MSKPLPGDTSLAGLIWVPGEGSSTGNVTGGRKFARHYFGARHTQQWPSRRSSRILLEDCGYGLAELIEVKERRFASLKRNSIGGLDAVPVR
jgi:hypothetical protein